ncbi:disks large-associated protein 5 isoform X2 [Anoplopoma fimbria]|uniref:disks large-associated protein 5 isoform X2 n=1 Tax=Anoplopoma fimbria TaxID=229290 RepID=UPI0023EAF653|nr:disks large-associated protein 5 isoform X2 [Anoplopoma fimbria]
MDSQFAHLRQRDTSVSMLRVKMSRRRSQSQKENRERIVNTRRQLAKLPEMEMSSLEASIAMANMSTIEEKTLNNAKSAKNLAGEERLKQLARWKERKALEKEKEMREKERKGVFKTGMYHPKDTLTIPSLPVVPASSTRAKETKGNTASSQSARITRSMKQHQPIERPLKMQDTNNVAKKAQPAVERSTRSRAAPVKLAPVPAIPKIKVSAVEPVVRASRTRTANRPPVTAAPVVKDKPKDVRATRSRAFVNHVAPFSYGENNSEAMLDNTVEPVGAKEAEMQEPEKKPCPPCPSPCPEDMVVDQAPTDSIPAVDPVEATSSVSSFAPKGFIFQAPTGLSSFQFEPLTPRSADAFLTPSPSFGIPEVPTLNIESQAEPSEPYPPKSPRRSPPRTSPTKAPPTPGSPLESKHDVPYFRSEIANETVRLTTLSVLWDAKVEDESIPEEMRDRMRTAVGQARLLMKERFKQFNGLVDDCELGRGERITTCTDLQGFWDMVYYQVEDVQNKFDALKEAESRGWVEEHKPPPRQKKVVKKPSAAPAKPTGTKGAAKSRLAAVKAAMKAKQQAAEAEKAAKDAGSDGDSHSLNSEEPQPQAEPHPTVVFDGGFFQVESPARPSVSTGSVRRSSRLSAAVLPQASPCSNYLSPRRGTRRSLALAQTPLRTIPSPAQPIHTPAYLRLTLDQTPAQAPKSQRGTPQSCQKRKGTVNVSLCFSPVKEVLSEDTQPEGHQEMVTTQENTASPSELSTPATVHSLPSIYVAEEQGETAEAVDVDLPLSPCKTTPTVSQAPETSLSLSFTLSPCVTPRQPLISSPPAVQGLLKPQEPVCNTPDNSFVEEIPGLDFERYLQPSQRCSLSPLEAMSPMAVDVEMESPRGQIEDLLTQQEPGPDSRVCHASLHPGPEGPDTPVRLSK